MGEETNATEPIMNFAETLHDFEKISRRCRDMLYEAHEREVDALRGDTYLDAVSDSVLAKHGLVRLPVDADGVRWTGEEQYATFDGSEYNVECLRKDCHGWMVQMIDLDGKQFRAPTELCRHVPDERRAERTCRVTFERIFDEYPYEAPHCSECGQFFAWYARGTWPHYCPNCGARVIEEGE
ncbi:MAG: hypothetical protein U0L51_08200 [Olegusella sp.]|nr:hypothetical protein [Olegusella sp.]